MTAAHPALEELDFISNEIYAEGYPHEAWTRLRREDPVHWMDRGVKVPFWAITKHEDVLWISRRPKEHLNAPRLAVFPKFAPPTDDEREVRHLLNMDAPDHGAYRKLAAPWFTPRAIRRLQPSIEQIARELLDDFSGDERELDFVTDIAAPLPLAVLAELLGVPRSDWKLMFRWTNALVGSGDEEYRIGESAQESATRARMQLFGYFGQMIEERRGKPREDMVSVLANAKIDGQPLPPMELLSYCFLLVIAGNETTRNAMSGGLLALTENPGELAKLRSDPADLARSAGEEIARWTTPVIQFCRTPTQDLELRGKKIRAGESMCLLYPSANRDEEVFDAPFEFRVDRHPNRHLAFGIGEHFCLGANLARLELQVLFRQLGERLESVELTGPAERLCSSFLGGVKHVPVRWRVRASA